MKIEITYFDVLYNQLLCDIRNIVNKEISKVGIDNIPKQEKEEDMWIDSNQVMTILRCKKTKSQKLRDEVV